MLSVDDQLLDLKPFVPSVALSAAMLRTARVHTCSVQAVVTVENATSFSELLSQIRPLNILAVYTGGFASPAVTGFLQNLRAAHPELPFFHWGDLDVGGFRILAHLRRQLGAVTALAMDAETLNLFRAHAQPLNAGERAALGQLRTMPELADCEEVIESLLATGYKLEQEAVTTDRIVQALASLK